MHTQPLFAGARVIGGAVSERHFARGLCLPSSSSLSETDQALVIDLLRDSLVPTTAAHSL